MKKIISLLLCLVLVLGLAACGGNTTPGGNDDSSTPGTSLLSRDEAANQGLLEGKLKIKTMNKGYGTKGLEAIARAYETENPNAKIEVIVDGNIDSTISNDLGLGVDANDTDIYFGTEATFPKYYLDQMEKFGNNSLLLDLTDFINTWTTYGGDKLIKDEIPSDLIDMLSIADIDNPEVKRTFALPWAGAGTCGFVYNTEIFEEVGIEVPKTTDEMFAAFDKMLEHNETHKNDEGYIPIVPIIYPGGNAMEYWRYISYVWWAQYEGYERFMQYWTLTDNGDLYAPSKDCFQQEGQLEALKITEKLIRGKYVLESSEGLNHTSVDTNFVKGDSKHRFAVTPNGDWFQNEAKTATGRVVPNKFKMMPTPILSSAAAKRGGVNNIENYAFTLAPKHNVFIPSYTANKYLALDFISFYFSEEGARLYMKNSNALLPRVSYDFMEQSEIDEFSMFIQSELEIVKSTGLKYIAEAEQLSPLRYFGNMPVTPSGMDVGETMMLGGKTAAQVVTDYNNYFKDNWNIYLTAAGV